MEKIDKTIQTHAHDEGGVVGVVVGAADGTIVALFGALDDAREAGRDCTVAALRFVGRAADRIDTMIAESLARGQQALRMPVRLIATPAPPPPLRNVRSEAARPTA